MVKKSSVIGALILIVLLFLMQTSVVFASLDLRDAQSWYWSHHTELNSIATGDVDGDAQMEIVTGGHYYDGYRHVGQLCIWDGTTFTLEDVRTWYWTSTTQIYSVAVGDVDGDTQMEIVTGGYYWDGTRCVAQLCVWNGDDLAFEDVSTWYWTDNTYINSVAVGDVDGDTQMEIVTGGYYWDGSRDVAQLCVWDGATLAFEDVTAWYWTDDTRINSVAVGDVDGDSDVEVVSGGYYTEGVKMAQLCVWDGATLALEDVRTWCGWSTTEICSVAVGDVDGDAQMEIVTGGSYHYLYGYTAQLCVWNGATLTLEDVTTWKWTSTTEIYSVAVGDVDGDTQMEIVTGGRYDSDPNNPGVLWLAQLCVWNGADLAFEDVRTWYWTDLTWINSVAVGDVDGDTNLEIVTGGIYDNDPGINLDWVAQLCTWECS